MWFWGWKSPLNWLGGETVGGRKSSLERFISRPNAGACSKEPAKS